MRESMNPHDQGATIEALDRFTGNLYLARKFLGLSRKKMNERATMVLEHLSDPVQEKLSAQLGLRKEAVMPRGGAIIRLDDAERGKRWVAYGQCDTVKEAAESIDMREDALWQFLRKNQDWAREHGYKTEVEKYVTNRRPSRSKNGPVRIVEPPRPVAPVDVTSTIRETLAAIEKALEASVRMSENITQASVSQIQSANENRSSVTIALRDLGGILNRLVDTIAPQREA